MNLDRVSVSPTFFDVQSYAQEVSGTRNKQGIVDKNGLAVILDMMHEQELEMLPSHQYDYFIELCRGRIKRWKGK